MESEQFNRIVEEQIQFSKSVLVDKAEEYATDDRLHNFKVAAKLQGVTELQALGGLMSKHTVSVYDMIRDDEEYSLDLWTEKITDHINYLLLLKALVFENKFTFDSTH